MQDITKTFGVFFTIHSVLQTSVQFCFYCWLLLALCNLYTECVARHCCYSCQCYFITLTSVVSYFDLLFLGSY